MQYYKDWGKQSAKYALVTLFNDRQICKPIKEDTDPKSCRKTTQKLTDWSNLAERRFSFKVVKSQ